MHVWENPMQMQYLVATLGVHVNGGEEAGLGGVRVDPTQRVQRPLVLHVKYLLLVQRLPMHNTPTRCSNYCHAAFHRHSKPHNCPLTHKHQAST